MTPAVKRHLDWPEKLAVAAVMVSAVTLLAGGIISAGAFLLCAFMGWTRVFDQVRAQGKPTLSGVGRIAVAIVLAISGFLLLPGKRENVTAPAKPTAPTFGKMEAIEACKDGVVARLAHPSTVKFPMLDYDFRQYAQDQADLLMSVEARNGFNLLVEFDVQCEFKRGKLAAVMMSEAVPH